MQHEALKQTAESIRYACRPAAIKALVQVRDTIVNNTRFPFHISAKNTQILDATLYHQPTLPIPFIHSG